METGVPKGGDGLKNIIVIVVIWGAFILLLLNNVAIRKVLSSIFSGLAGSSKIVALKNVIFLSENNIISGANFYSKATVNIFDIVQSPANPKLFYAATSSGIFASSDGGINWYKINIPKELEKSTFYRIFINPKKPFEISLVAFENNKAMLYRTKDNFYSISKLFELDNDTLEKMAKGKSISTIAPADGKFIIGTSEK